MGESDLHNTLKHVGLALLLRKGCSPAGTEVRLSVWESGWSNSFELPASPVTIVDAAGVTWVEFHREKRKKYDYSQPYRGKGIFAIEAKVSRSDFQRGFCTHGFNKLWLITPPGLVETNELPGGIGLYEYDAKTADLQLKVHAALHDYQPSEYAIQEMERQILWGGYGSNIFHLTNEFEGGRLKKIFGGQFTLDQVKETVLDDHTKEDEEA